MKVTGQRITRGRNLRGIIGYEQSADASLRSAASVFRLLLHLSFCIASLVLGFRLSRESLIAVVSLTGSEPRLPRASALPFVWPTEHLVVENGSHFQDSPLQLSEVKPGGLSREDGVKSSRVHVGRHDILIRPWSHPDPVETMVAQSLIARVQQEQRKLYGLTERKPLLVITPTYRRTFQALHLSSLMHTLMLVPGPLSWIVVEAGGKSAETATILSKSGLNYHHVPVKESMPASWPQRHHMETLLRIRGLRHIRENVLEGIVVFADESNSHRLEFFDEVQNVQWVGAFSLGLLMPSQASDEGNQLLRWNSSNVASPTAGFFPVQGPACNQSGLLVGWHSEAGSVSVVSGASKISPNFEWAGFVLNSAAILDGAEKPSWIKDFDQWVPRDVRALSPTAIAFDEAYIEPLGNCGRDILVWWVRIEARHDSKYPEGWVTEQKLEVVVPAKHTPWPEPPPPPPPSPPAINPPADLKRSDDGSAPKEKKKKGKHSRTRQGKKKSVEEVKKIAGEHSTTETA